MPHQHVFICQQCGPLRAEQRETHRSIYVKGDWDGFTPAQRHRYDPASTYLVNPAHPETVAQIPGYDPERAREMATDHPWLCSPPGMAVSRLLDRLNPHWMGAGAVLGSLILLWLIAQKLVP